MTDTLTWKPVLCDFGNALAVQTTSSDVGLWRRILPTRRYCTLTYAAPEVLMTGMPYERPSDVWSLGLLLAEFEQGYAVFIGMSASMDWEQLLDIWQEFGYTCSAAGVRGRKTFLGRLRANLLRHVPLSALERRVHGSAGTRRLSRATLDMLWLDPCLRPQAKAVACLDAGNFPRLQYS
jgi:serine/threonine protein kinase